MKALRAHLTSAGCCLLVALVALVHLPVLLVAQSNSMTPPPDWNNGDVFVGVSNGSYQVWHSANPTSSSPTYKQVNTISDTLGGATNGCGFDLAYRFFGTNSTNNLVDRYAIDNEHPIAQQFPTTSAGLTPGSGASRAQSVTFDGGANLYIGYSDLQSGQGVIEHWAKDIDHSSQTFGLYKLSGSPINVPVDNTHGPSWIDLDSDGVTLYYTSQGSTIRTFNTATHTPCTFVTLSGGTTLFALRILPGNGPKQVLVAAQGNALLVNSAGVVTRFSFSGDKNLQALSLDSSVPTRAWVGDASSNDFILFDYTTKTKIAAFNTSAGSAGPLGGVCVDGSFSAAEVAAQAPPPMVKTFTLSPSTKQNLTANTLSFSDTFTGATFTDTFADLSQSITVTVRDSLVDPSLALSDSAVFSFNFGGPGGLLPGNMICDTALTTATGHPNTCELFEVEASSNSAYTISNVQVEPPSGFTTDLPNLRLLRNLDEDITDNVDCCSGTRTTKCVYTTNQQTSDSTLEICEGGFTSPSTGTTFTKKQTSTITFKFKVSPSGTCPNGQSPQACSTTGGVQPCLTPLLTIVQLQPSGAAPVPVPVIVAGNSGGFPVFTLSGNTWQLQAKTTDMQAGFTYVATMVDVGAGAAGSATPSSSIPSIFTTFTLK